MRRPQQSDESTIGLAGAFDVCRVAASGLASNVARARTYLPLSQNGAIVSLPSDPNQDGFEFAGEPADADPSEAILSELDDSSEDDEASTLDGDATE
ncbi:hypothetical protein ITJ38_15515 [Agreia pratensis]|uniref:Uncharacterized protein n=1 Tax=Agreia pratensis TaxID=150121 RepID=A0A1X7KTJ5_9MICO|nr:hypothetical protein [Agreia pratensis]MBF4635818.1 hypothetical protein [Agreia pratensis]SMG44870.1 hypothetical protein SAMN06296010_2930 [Agreia pratensis]